MARPALGRGLGALIPTESPANQNLEVPKAVATKTIASASPDNGRPVDVFFSPPGWLQSGQGK